MIKRNKVYLSIYYVLFMSAVCPIDFDTNTESPMLQLQQLFPELGHKKKTRQEVRAAIVACQNDLDFNYRILKRYRQTNQSFDYKSFVGWLNSIHLLEREKSLLIYYHEHIIDQEKIVARILAIIIFTIMFFVGPVASSF